MTDLRVHPADKPLVGSVPVPSDKSIAHRAFIIATLAEGKSTVVGTAFGADNRSTMDVLRKLGATIDERKEGAKIVVDVFGLGLFGLRPPAGDLDCGNSGTTMRLMAGVLAGQTFPARLVGDVSLSGRPMRRIVAPLRERGAHVVGRPNLARPGEVTAPLAFAGLAEGQYLRALELTTEVASAQVKSAAILSGLFAHGVTFVREPTVSRDHTERMLAAAGAPIRSLGPLVTLDPEGWDGKLRPMTIEVPGDLSAAAFLIAAAQIVEGSRITVRGVGVNTTRTGFLEIVRDMGAGLAALAREEQGGEPTGDISAWNAPLVGGRAGGELLVRAIDEVPVLCALAARASGRTVIRDAAELRVKESDRLAAMSDVLARFGVSSRELPDGLEIEGKDGPLTAAVVDTRGDHRIAMSAAVLALCADGPSTIRDVDAIGTSFPRFVGTMRALGAPIEVVAAP